jgi:flagellar motor switch protein FliM
VSDVLSQSEIDELLNALNTGDMEDESPKKAISSTESSLDEIDPESKKEKNIKIHDFRRPSKFAKDHLKTLHIIYENYARLLNNYLSGFLRASISVEVLAVEPLTFYEFNNAISTPAVLGIVNLKPLPGSIIIDISPNIAFAIIDRVLGGLGVGVDKIREFTEVEMALLERVMKNFIDAMRESWENIIEIQPYLEKIETNVQFAQLVSPNEITALATLSIKISGTEGMVNVCIPHMVVEPVVPKLSTKFWFSTTEKTTQKEVKESIQSKIQKTYVPLKAVLGRTEISVHDFLDLKEGDVLPLDSKVHADVEVFVGELMKFYAKPGLKKNKMALKINKVLLREED